MSRNRTYVAGFGVQHSTIEISSYSKDRQTCKKNNSGYIYRALYIKRDMNIHNIKKISTILLVCVILWWYTQAVDIIDFSVFQKQATKQNLSDISRTQQLKYIKYIHQQPCKYTKENINTYIVTPACIFNNSGPNIEFKEAIEIIRPYIETFNTVYNESAQTFIYEGTKPIISKLWEAQPQSYKEKIALAKAQVQWQKIRINTYTLALQTIQNANFYVVYRDTSLLKKCTKQNYLVAMNILNNYIINPWETLNLNKQIANAKGYCKWTGRKDLMLYGWVCGASTQLFRAALLSPQITITKRYGHSERLVPYYSDYIFGDDAAMYEMSKQFEIKNQSSEKIYIKYLAKDEGMFLVMMTPKKDTQWVIINKTQTQWLSASVEKIIYTKQPKYVIGKETFLSTYTKKEYDTW